MDQQTTPQNNEPRPVEDDHSFTPTPIMDAEPDTAPFGATKAEPSTLAFSPAQPVEEPIAPQPSSTPVTHTVEKSKKGHAGLLVIIFVILVLAVTGFIIYTALKPGSKTQASNTQTTTQTAPLPAIQDTINAATTSLTSAPTDESTTTNTDDSSTATDASTSTGNVGASVDESNF
jgi:hypothetical protein